MMDQAAFQVYEVTGGQTAHLEELCTLFAELFPHLAHRVARLRIKANNAPDVNPNFINHQWLVMMEEQPAAFVVFKYARQRHIGLGIYLGVKPEYRSRVLENGKRFSHSLIELINTQLEIDAARLGDPPVLGYVVEVEAEKLVSHYRNFGFVELPVEYIEPRLTQEEAFSNHRLAEGDFQRVVLGAFPTQPEMNVMDENFLRQAVNAWMVDHYGLSEDHWAVQRVLRSIQQIDRQEKGK